MNVKELMIGNWVEYTKYSHFPMQVVSLGDDYVYLDFEGNEGDVLEPSLEDMQPIEVTEEILLKNGFEKGESMVIEGETCTSYSRQFNYTFIDVTYGISNFAGRNWYCHIDNCDRQTIGGFDFQYIHQLQNGIRLITGKDMEVKL